jgi:hypothetical protein
LLRSYPQGPAGKPAGFCYTTNRPFRNTYQFLPLLSGINPAIMPHSLVLKNTALFLILSQGQTIMVCPLFIFGAIFL